MDNEEKNKEKEEGREEKEVGLDEYKALLGKSSFKIPKVGELIKGSVISASKSEVKLDINGIMTGVVRGPELYEEDDSYADLKPGGEVEATVIEEENENGELELSFRYAGQEKAWASLKDAFKHKKVIKVKVAGANRGGLLVKYRQIAGFLPVSQLAPENYPRVGGGDKSKILEKLKSFVGREFEVKLMTMEEKEDKMIFSEKEAWNEKRQDVISKFKAGTVVDGVITAITSFGVFISFGDNLEGLIHISELAWQRIDDPADLYRVGDKIGAEVVSLENGKIFLSAKKLIKDPWHDVEKKYKVGQVVEGDIIKVNPFGLFVKLDNDIHGLAHVSQLELAPKQRIYDKFKAGEKAPFKIVSIESKEHRLGLSAAPELVKKEEKKKDEKEKEEKKEEKQGAAGEKRPAKKEEKKSAKKEKSKTKAAGKEKDKKKVESKKKK